MKFNFEKTKEEPRKIVAYISTMSSSSEKYMAMKTLSAMEVLWFYEGYGLPDVQRDEDFDPHGDGVLKVFYEGEEISFTLGV